jgi:hypothetical protein
MSDVTLKVSEKTFGEVFNKLWPAFKAPFSGDGSWAGLWGAVEGQFHIVQAGDVEFNDANTFTASEIDLQWDKLIFKIGIDIPTIKIGKFCLLPTPDFLKDFFGSDDCLVEFPGGQLFTAVPDPYVKFNLSAIFQYIITEITIISKVKMQFTTEPPPDSNYWGIYLDLVALHVEPIQIQDTLGQSTLLLIAAIDAAVQYIYSILPATFVIDVLLGIVGFPTLSEFILNILDIQESVEEWLTKWLNIPIGIDQLIYQKLFDAVLSDTALYKIDDPVTLLTELTPSDPTNYGGFGPSGADGTMPAVVTLAKVTANVLQPAVTFTSHEMMVTFDFAK